jgi:anthranilate/para-aminobenzoate synthase component I
MELFLYRKYRLNGETQSSPGRWATRFFGGAVGYLGYETATHFEKLPSPEKDTLNLPQAIFMFVVHCWSSTM